MAHRQLSIMLRHLHRLAGAPDGSVSDMQLLARFIEQRDQAAFELLMWRHERMVLGLCRRILRHEQDAEDAFQATFLALACKAGGIGKREAVASWLYKVAYRVALRERGSGGNRVRREALAAQVAAALPAGGRFSLEPSAEAMERDLRAALHEEVNRLPEKYRAPVVLCYLEGRTNEEAALQMRCPTGTVVTRLARARRRLRSRLARRGVALSAVALIAALAQSDAVAAVPALLRDLTVRAALHFAMDRTAAGLVSAKVATLTRGVLKTMFLTKLKHAATLLVSIGLIGVGSGVFAYHNLHASPTLALSWDESTSEPGPTDKVARPEPPKEVDKKKEDDKNPTAKEVVTQSFKVGKSPKVVVELGNGAIDIDASAEAAVEARVTKQGQGKTEQEAKEALKRIELKMTQDGDTIHVQANIAEDTGKTHTSVGASAELKVPPGAILELHTHNGAVAVAGGTGKVLVETHNGKIQAKKSKGPLRLQTHNGEIVVTDATGPIDVATHNGPIEIQGEKAVVKAETANGHVHFQGSFAKGAQSLSTHNGAIVVSLPASASFRMDAETTHGRIKSDFSAEDKEKDGKTHLISTVGKDPVTDIKLHTTNGGITIRKQEAKE